MTKKKNYRAKKKKHTTYPHWNWEHSSSLASVAFSILAVVVSALGVVVEELDCTTTVDSSVDSLAVWAVSVSLQFCSSSPFKQSGMLSQI